MLKRQTTAIPMQFAATHPLVVSLAPVTVDSVEMVSATVIVSSSWQWFVCYGFVASSRESDVYYIAPEWDH